MPSKLTGQIETITYANEDNGYIVAKVTAQGHSEPVTVVGRLPAVAPGEILDMSGTWKDHSKYGEQFEVGTYTIKVPATVYGIRKYLGSGLIKGLGPKMAERIVGAFGKETLDVIEHHIEKLIRIEGIGKKRVESIRTAWTEQKEIRDVMIFLQTFGVGIGYAAKIFKKYKGRSVQVVKSNPFRLADDLFGVGFKTADAIAEKLGFPKDASLRIEAGVIHLLKQFADEGHVYYPYNGFVHKSRDVLEVNTEIVQGAIDRLAAEKKIVIEKADAYIPLHSKGREERVYLTGFYQSEANVAGRLNQIMSASRSIREMNVRNAIEWAQKKLSIHLAEQQVEAIRCVLENKITIITGGPGTGKTTIVGALLKIFGSLRIRILLAAPTGRAAKQLSEATGYEARTIHRMLEFSMHKGGFQKNENNPLDCDLLVVDEASMIDIALMQSLLKAVQNETTLVLVGDVYQLPSVGPGTVLKDMISSEVFPVIELNKIFRQARESQIVVNAHKINNGILPAFGAESSPAARKDFYFRERHAPEEVLAFILELVKVHLPERGFDRLTDIQVLTPMNKGIVGVENLNRELQKALNPGEDCVMRGSKNFRLNDKVMQIKNNYDKGVFNGDIGRIQKIRPIDQEIHVLFDGRTVKYDYSELDEIVLAYAITVHKSQGSEYPAVIFPVVSQHYILLQRNLIYTAVTRAKDMVVIIGTKKAMSMAVKNDRTQRRFTSLADRLRSA